MNKNGVPAMQPKMQAPTQTLGKGDMIVCPCGGLSEVVLLGFLPEHSILVGSRPEVSAVQSLVCRSCNELVEAPFIRKAAREVS